MALSLSNFHSHWNSIKRDDDLEEELQFDMAMIEDEEAVIYKYDFNDGNEGQLYIEVDTADYGLRGND